MFRRWVVPIVLGGLLLAAATGCVDENGIVEAKRGDIELNLTPEQARLEMVAAQDAAVAIIGGEWDNGDSFLPSRCDVGTGEGVYFSGHRTRTDDTGNLTKDGDALALAWENAGYQTMNRSYSATHRLVTAAASDGMQLSYAANKVEGAVRAGLISDSACVAADFVELRREYGEQLLEKESAANE